MKSETYTPPNVAGRKIRGSNVDFERACLVHIERLQNSLGDYDSAMLDTFCEAVRLVREYSDAMNPLFGAINEATPIGTAVVYASTNCPVVSSTPDWLIGLRGRITHHVQTPFGNRVRVQRDDGVCHLTYYQWLRIALNDPNHEYSKRLNCRANPRFAASGD